MLCSFVLSHNLGAHRANTIGRQLRDARHNTSENCEIGPNSQAIVHKFTITLNKLRFFIHRGGIGAGKPVCIIRGGLACENDLRCFGAMRVSDIFNRVIVPSMGGMIGIACMVVFDKVTNVPLFMVPFATSIVLVMATPLSLFARPQNIIGGHLLSAAAGFAVLWLFGSSPWLAAPAVGLAIALMQLTNTLHPPAGLNPFIIVTLAPGWNFFFVPIMAGAILLVALAWVFHKVTQPGVYPIRPGK